MITDSGKKIAKGRHNFMKIIWNSFLGNGMGRYSVWGCRVVGLSGCWVGGVLLIDLPEFADPGRVNTITRLVTGCGFSSSAKATADKRVVGFEGRINYK